MAVEEREGGSLGTTAWATTTQRSVGDLRQVSWPLLPPVPHLTRGWRR